MDEKKSLKLTNRISFRGYKNKFIDSPVFSLVVCFISHCYHSKLKTLIAKQRVCLKRSSAQIVKVGVP